MKSVVLQLGSNVKVTSAPSGSVSLMVMILASLRLLNVQVTVSPGSSSIASGALPSAHVALVRSQPPGTVSATEYVALAASGPESFDSPSLRLKPSGS